jgi:methionyl-tRNA synthetase
MNLTGGGDHFIRSEETKEKISKSRMGIVYGNDIIEKTKKTKRNRTYESRAGSYEIYNQNNELIHKFRGDFRKTLENLNIPYKSFNRTHNFNRKIKKGNYIGWYAIKLHI